MLKFDVSVRRTCYCNSITQNIRVHISVLAEALRDWFEFHSKWTDTCRIYGSHSSSYEGFYEYLAGLLPVSRWFLVWLILRPWRWMKHVLRKRRLTFSGLHGVISQKIELFNVRILCTCKGLFIFEGSITLSNDAKAIALRHNPESNFRSWAMTSLVVGRFAYASENLDKLGFCHGVPCVLAVLRGFILQN
jgi:hypothetical protein